ncbi:MAG: ribonuclease P [Euryarchaeota archaeon]|jgi:pre-rRNA-processing protein TSR3|nr:ribonuclease P [Euryarchaeota archaeon]|tara:strand:+ start:644 stop:1102 length:459 start_codon:yes stop_codon:yes gene_type:complete
MSYSIRILCFDQDDPKKCTAKRLEKFNLSDNHSSFKTLPPMGIVLDPFSTNELNSDDIPLAEVGGIVGVDCSWNKAPETFSRLRLMGLEPRSLPSVIPANPVNSGKAGKLTTAEAIASALLICGQNLHAEEIMSIFKWGPAFIEINSHLKES